MGRNLSTHGRARVTQALVVALVAAACDSETHAERVQRMAQTSDAVVDSMGAAAVARIDRPQPRPAVS